MTQMRIQYRDDGFYDGTDRLVTTTEIATILGLSVFHIRKLARDKSIPRVKIKNQWMFNPRRVKEAYFYDSEVTDVENIPRSQSRNSQRNKSRISQKSSNTNPDLSLVADL